MMSGPTGQHIGTGDRVTGDELAGIYAEHSGNLLKLAVLLAGDVGSAEDIVSNAFATMYRARSRLRCRDDMLACLRRAVVCGARAAAGRDIRGWCACPDPADAAVIEALRTLPSGQREALVLRYYGQLSDMQAADAMGVRTAVLRANVDQGLAALRAVLTARAAAPENASGHETIASAHAG